MKNKWLLIVFGIVVILGGIYFLTKENLDSDLKDDTGDSEQEQSKDLRDSHNPDNTKVPDDSNFVIGEDIDIGKPGPNFKYKDKDGKEIRLTNLSGEEISLKNYEGKIVLLNFWGTWCKWCDVEMPDLDKLDKENDDLVVLAVNVNEDKDVVDKYIEEGGYDFEVVLDLDGEIAKKYLISSYPTTYFLDKEGVLLGGVPGMMEYEQMEEVLGAIRQGIE